MGGSAHRQGSPSRPGVSITVIIHRCYERWTGLAPGSAHTGKQPGLVEVLFKQHKGKGLAVRAAGGSEPALCSTEGQLPAPLAHAHAFLPKSKEQRGLGASPAGPCARGRAGNGHCEAIVPLRGRRGQVGSTPSILGIQQHGLLTGGRGG